MNSVNFDNPGGFPLDQDALKFMQSSYGSLQNLAVSIAGTTPSIISGCIETGGNTSEGWVIINGEVLPFQGGPTGSKVTIQEVTTPVLYEDEISRDTYKVRTAVFSGTGTDWSEFKRIQSLVSLVPAGVVVMWSGAVGSIPTGWALCDGTNGTPDLRGRFIVGYHSGDTDYNANGKTGGAKTYTLDASKLPVVSPWALSQTPHSHRVKGNANTLAGLIGVRLGDGPGASWAFDETEAVNANVSLNNNSGGGQPFDKRPPFYTLAYIVKL